MNGYSPGEHTLNIQRAPGNSPASSQSCVLFMKKKSQTFSP